MSFLAFNVQMNCALSLMLPEHLVWRLVSGGYRRSTAEWGCCVSRRAARGRGR